MNPIDLAYMAGVIDSDGCIGIKKSTYAMRVKKDASQPIYSERITLKQVEPQAVELAHAMFGGHRSVTDPTAKRGRPLHTWHIHSKSAGAAIVALLPYLRIKRKQAENAIRLRELVSTRRCWPVPPIIAGEEMVTVIDFATLVGVKKETIRQAIQHRSIPSVKSGMSRLIPKSFTEQYRFRISSGGKARRSPEITTAMEDCYQHAKELNLVGQR